MKRKINRWLFSKSAVLPSKTFYEPFGILTYEADSVLIYKATEFPGLTNKSRVSVLGWLIISWLLRFAFLLIERGSHGRQTR